MGILWNIKNILNKKRFRYLVFIAVLSLVAVSTAEAKTINNSLNFASEERLLYFENLYKRSEYQNYILVIDNDESSYYSSNSYYICLTNSDINFSDNINVSSNCDEMYRYYRYSSSNYILEKVSDNELNVVNSVFYTNNAIDTNYLSDKMLIALNIGLLSFFLTYVLFKVFRS